MSNLKLFLALVALCVSTTWAQEPIISQYITTTIASGETVGTSNIDIRGSLAVLSVTAPNVSGTPTLTIDINAQYGILASKASIAENATTRLDDSDFDVNDIPLDTGYTITYTLTTATATPETIVTAVYGYGI